MVDFGLSNEVFIGQVYDRQVVIDRNLGLSYNLYGQGMFPGSTSSIENVTINIRSLTPGTSTFDVQLVNGDNISEVYFELIGGTVTGTIPTTIQVPATATPFPEIDINIAAYARYRIPTNSRLISGNILIKIVRN